MPPTTRRLSLIPWTMPALENSRIVPAIILYGPTTRLFDLVLTHLWNTTHAVVSYLCYEMVSLQTMYSEASLLDPF